MHKSMGPEARLYQFLKDIYCDLSRVTRVEVDVEEQSGGVQGTPHREAIQVRVYADEEQVFPDVGNVPYWKGVLKKYPDLFAGCQSLQEHMETMMNFLADEQIYLEYGLDWPASALKWVPPLCFSVEGLCRIAGEKTERVVGEEKEEDDKCSENGSTCLTREEAHAFIRRQNEK